MTVDRREFFKTLGVGLAALLLPSVRRWRDLTSSFRDAFRGSEGSVMCWVKGEKLRHYTVWGRKLTVLEIAVLTDLGGVRIKKTMATEPIAYFPLCEGNGDGDGWVMVAKTWGADNG